MSYHAGMNFVNRVRTPSGKQWHPSRREVALAAEMAAERRMEASVEVSHEQVASGSCDHRGLFQRMGAWIDRLLHE